MSIETAKIEQIRKECEQKYLALFNTLTQGVVYQDAEGKIISANPSAERILGLSLEQMQGLKSIDSRWKAIREDGSNFPGEEHPISVALKTGKVVKDVIQGIYHPAKDAHIWIKVNAVPLFLEGEATPYQAYVTFEDITERKKAEENYRMLFREMQDGFALHEIVCSPDGTPVDYRFLDVNPAFERMTSLNAKDIIGRTVLEALPRTEQYWIDTYGKVALNGVPVIFENYTESLHKHFKVTAFRPAANQFACIFSDITERKRWEEDLKSANSKLNAFWKIATIENASQKIICDHILESITEMTESAYGFYGFINKDESVMTIHSWSGEAMKGCSMVDKPVHFPISQAGVWGVAIRQRKPLILNDYSVHHPAKKGLPVGHVALTNLLVIPVFSRGSIVAVAAVANRKADYTESDAQHISAFAEAVQAIIDRKRSEETLVESETHFRTLADNGQALIWTSGIDKKCTYFNKPWLDFTGRSIEQELGDGWAEGVHPEDLQRCIDIYVSAFDRREKFSMDYRMRHASGEYRWIQDNGTPRYNSKGEFIGYIGHCLDINDRKLSEENRLKLEHALNQSQRLESLGILAGGIAHDFNNLLGGIFGYIEMALDGTKEEKYSNYLAKALGTIERARGLTQQLLTFAKGGAPKQEIDPLFPFIENTVQFVLSGSSISAHYSVPKNLWLCEFDKNQIGQVIDNIVINAQHAMPTGGSIEISAKNVFIAAGLNVLLVEGNYVRISIRDTGIGMPKEILPRIFDPFFTTKEQGQGLGLATCYSIIKRHGGAIDVESETGKGTTFHIYLPASSAYIQTASKNQIMEHKGHGTIIVMDDEEVIRETLSSMLESLGYSVKSSVNGQDTIELYSAEIRDNRYVAALFVDLTIRGGLSGKETVDKIRKTDKKVPVFVISGYADNPIMANPSLYGFTESLSKPFTRNEVIKLLSKYVGNLTN